MAKVIFVGMERSSVIGRGDEGPSSIKYNTSYNKHIRTFNTLNECRDRISGISSRSWGIYHNESRKGFVYNAQTGRMLGIIKGDGWYFYKDGAWWHRFINPKGVLDTYYPATKVDGIKRKPDTLMDRGIPLLKKTTTKRRN